MNIAILLLQSLKTLLSSWLLPCTKSLPVKEVLKSRHLVEDSCCPWCEEEDESFQHAFFFCSKVARYWEDLNCQDLVRGIMGEEMGDTLVRWCGLEKQMVQRGCYVLWNLWAERNKKVFENICTPSFVVCQRIGRQVEEYNHYSSRIYGRAAKRPTISSSRWIAPPSGVIKLNTDACVGDDGWIGLGVAARDSTGRVCFAAMRRIRAYWPPEVAECKAIHMAVRLAKTHGMEDVIVESDAQVVTTRLTKAALFFSDLDSILGDVLFMCQSFHSISFNHVKRDGNTVIHNLARVVPFGVEQCWECHVPRDVAPYVLMDTLSLD